MIEIFASVLTLICVILFNIKNYWGWPVAIVAALLYMVVFIQTELWFQTVLQLIFIWQSIYGWIHWKSQKDELNVIVPNYSLVGTHVIFFVLLSLTIYAIASKLNIILNPIDIITTFLALLANYYLSKAILQSWLVWIIVDILLIIMFIQLELWWSTGLYILLLINAENSFIRWKKQLKQ